MTLVHCVTLMLPMNFLAKDLEAEDLICIHFIEFFRSHISSAKLHSVFLILQFDLAGSRKINQTARRFCGRATQGMCAACVCLS